VGRWEGGKGLNPDFEIKWTQQFWILHPGGESQVEGLLALEDACVYSDGVASLKDIREVAMMVAEKFHPRRIILFGSHANQTQREDSDVDLLVVMPHDGPAAESAARIRESVRLPFPCDLLVRSPEKVEERLSLRDPFIRNIVLNGRVLYESSRQ
jgi:predicted nucleotidyltransferase